MFIPAIISAIYKEPTGVIALGLTSLIILSYHYIMLRAGRVRAIRNQPAENIPGFAYGLLDGGEQCAHDCRPQLPLLLAVAHSSWAAEGLIAVSVLSFCPGGGNAVICWLWQIVAGRSIVQSHLTYALRSGGAGSCWTDGREHRSLFGLSRR